MPAQDYQLLLRVGADLLDARKGMQGLGGDINETSTAAQQLGESVDAASARIQKMVEASTANARAAQASSDAMASASRQAAAYAAGAQTGTARGPDLTAAQAATFNAAVLSKIETLRALDAAFATNLASSEGAAAAEAALDEAMAAGTITAREQATYLEALTAAEAAHAAATEADTAAVVENTAATAINAGTTRELGVLLGELARGNTARLEGSLVTLANRTGVLSALFSPMALMITGVVAEFATFAVAAEKTASENEALNASIQRSGNYAGTTVSQLNQLSANLATAAVGVGTVRQALETLVASGKVGEGALQALGQAAVDMAALTGESGEKAAQSVLEIFDGTTQSLVKANDQYHFLTTAIYDQITALEAEGDTQRAMDVAAEAFHAAAMQRIQEEQAGITGLARIWDNVKTAAAGYWNQFKTGASVLAGTADLQTQIYALQGQKSAASSGQYSAIGKIRNTFFGSSIVDQFQSSFVQWTQQDEAKLQQLQAQLKAQQDQAELTGQKQALSTAAVDAAADLDRMGQSLDRNAQKQAELNKLQADYLKLWNGADANDPRLQGVQAITNGDGSVSFSGGQYDQLVAQINKRYAARTPRAKSDTGAQDAQQELIKLLNDVQGQLDPTAKAWATYNDAVQQANNLAAKAVTAHGANIDAINAERDAIIANAAAARDDALAKAADKDRDAFEKLRASLTRVNDTKLDKVSGQLKQLGGYLDRGTITQSEYDQTSTDVVQNSLKPLPQVRTSTTNSSLSGAFRGLDRLDSQEGSLDSTYEQNIQQLTQYWQNRQITTQQYMQLENQQYQQHATAIQQIEDARNQVILSGLSSSFGQAANVLKSAFGQQSVAYKAAFALSKAFAVAQAAISLATNVAKASEAGFPQNLPLIASAIAQGAQIASLISGANFSGASSYATGGAINGPGTSTSDSVPIWASKGEFMQRAAAVDYYGLPFMHAVNSLALPKPPAYAEGGLIDDAPHLSPSAPASSRAAPGASTGGASSQPSQQGVRFVLVDDARRLPEALQGPVGEQAFVVHLKNYMPSIAQYVNSQR